MSLLDRLREERGEQKKRQAEDARREARLQKVYEREIRPALHDAYHYFKEFFEHLDALDAETGISLVLDDHGLVRGLRQGRHFVRVDKSDQIGNLHCGRKVTGKDLTLRVRSQPGFEAMCARLEKYGFQYEKRLFRDGEGHAAGGSLLVPMIFIQSVSFTADIPSSSVEVQVAHFGRFGIHTRRFRPDQVGEPLFDDIGAFVMGHSETLFRTHVPGVTRENLQRTLEADREQRDREIEDAKEARRHAEELRRQSHSLRKFYEKFRRRP